jgi:sulfatase modifying factor 1
VWEWCWDWYDNDYYDDSPQNDPTGPVSGSYRVFRGGSWFLDASGTRVAYRGGNSPGYSSDNRGFRLVRD